MSQKENDNLIGYDPLAWMNQEENAENVNQPLDSSIPSAGRVQNAGIEQKDEAIVETKLEDESKVILRATQNLQNIAELHEKLMSALENTSGAISIDASAVTSIDTATLQLFVALKQEILRVHRDLVFDFPSERFLDAAGFLGILTILDLDKIPAGLF